MEWWMIVLIIAAIWILMRPAVWLIAQIAIGVVKLKSKIKRKIILKRMEKDALQSK